VTTPAAPFDGYNEEDADYRSLMMDILRWETFQACVVAEWLKQQFPHIRYVTDLGAGPGTYLVPFKLLDCSVFGVDACSKGGILLRESEFRRDDLRFPLTYLRDSDPDDLCICLEVGEHIHAEYADTLVDNVCRAAPLVLWSAATPGQGGLHHHNCAPPSYWLDKFAHRGYRVHEKQEDMRKHLFATLAPLCEVGAASWWLVQNSFLLVKE
jgi:hypothetical protein